MTDIALTSLFDLGDPSRYKLHVARWNQNDQPLDVYVRDKREWYAWNEWRASKDEFNREFVFSLIDFYHETDTWLFGGIYRVLDRDPTPRDFSYTIEELPEYTPFVGRLKVHLPKPSRGRAFLLEKHLHLMKVLEILREPYSGQMFPGYDAVSLDFHELEPLIRQEKPDWKTALSNVKGVYVVTDRHNGKMYVGSAYSADGVWSRWASYARTGHGHNTELTAVINRNGLKYALQNFRFTLVEHFSTRVDDETVIARESFWKDALLSRSEFGYNKN